MSLKEILIIGSLHYDIFLDSSSLPRTGETVIGNKWYPKLGGKGGNQALAASLNSVGIKLISAVGKDIFANYILKNLKKKNIDIKYIQRLDNCNSGISVAISNNEGDYGAVIVSGANLKIKSEVMDDINIWNNIGILMLQNEVDENINILAAKKAKENRVKVFYNAAPAKKINSNLYKLVNILLVNIVEAEDISDQKIENLQDIKNVSKILSKDISTVIISAGEYGAVLCENNNEPIHFEGLKVKVNSTHGAGDVFAGTICASLILGKKIEEAIEIANFKAAEFISKKINN